MKLFTVPADFNNETIDKYFVLNKRQNTAKVVEVYGQTTMEKLKYSGRPISAVPEVSYEQLERFVEYSVSRGIKFNYTFNAACMGNLEYTNIGRKEIEEFVKRLLAIGINTFTIASPAVIDIVKNINPEAHIIVSTIAEVNSLNKAEFYKKLGVERIVVDADINRKFGLLKAISDFWGDGIEVIVNNVCINGCPMKIFHYNHDSHAISDASEASFFSRKCIEQKYEKAENLLKCNWIRPEDILMYENIGISHYKIQGRPNVLQGRAYDTLEAYMNQSFDGNLLDLLMLFMPRMNSIYISNKALDGFVEAFAINDMFCNRGCHICSHCKKYAEKSMNLDYVEQNLKEIRDLFGG